MALSSARIQEAQKLLNELLGSRISHIIKLVTADPSSGESYVASIRIPEDVSGLSMDEALSLVARTSNRYSELAQLSAVVNAQQKQAEAQYKIKYKSSLKGKNLQEREANAVEAASDEMVELSIIESVVALIEPPLISARIASESARKILDKKQAEQQGQNREISGYFMDKDFN